MIFVGTDNYEEEAFMIINAGLMITVSTGHFPVNFFIYPVILCLCCAYIFRYSTK